jgi:hypothetical protein
MTLSVGAATLGAPWQGRTGRATHQARTPFLQLAGGLQALWALRHPDQVHPGPAARSAVTAGAMS